jgi:NDP-sugar pyrophosphorylase family protein
MELAIIAAGRGSRLRSAGINISKPLIKINNIPLIKRLIDCGIQNGADKIHCIINEESVDLKEYLLNEKFPVKVHLIVKSTPGSLYSFFELAPLIAEKYFCLAMPDSVFPCEEFNRFISFSIIQDNFDGILAVTGSIDEEKSLYIELDNKAVVTRFSDQNINTGMVTGGLYFFSTSIFNEMPYALSENMMHLKNYFQHMLKRGYHFKAFTFSKIIDVDRVDDIEAAEQFVHKAVSQNRLYINNLDRSEN